jgi:hypothetical protein
VNTVQENLWLYGVLAVSVGGNILLAHLYISQTMRCWHERAKAAANYRVAKDARAKQAANTDAKLKAATPPIKLETPVGSFHWLPQFSGSLGDLYKYSKKGGK